MRYTVLQLCALVHTGICTQQKCPRKKIQGLVRAENSACENHLAFIRLPTYKGAHIALASFCTYKLILLQSAKPVNVGLHTSGLCMSETYLWLNTVLSDFGHDTELQDVQSLSKCVLVVLKWELRSGGASFQKEQHGNFGILLHPFLPRFLSGKCWKASLKGHPCVPAYTGSLTLSTGCATCTDFGCEHIQSSQAF